MNFIYPLVKAALFPVFRIFYRRVYFSNRKKLPKGKPVLLACNHPNSFLDGVSVSYYLFRKTYILTRGDAFKKPLANAVLRSLRLLPIFRRSDSESHRESLANFNATLDECYTHFNLGHIILIFSEAIAKPEKRVRPVKKGTARLAFDIMIRSNWQLDLHLVPTGINYTHFNGFRKELMIDFGDGIRLQPFKDLYEQNSSKAINELTQLIETDLKKRVVACEQIENDELFELHNQIARNNIPKPFFGYWFTSPIPLGQELSAANAFNAYMQSAGNKGTFVNKLNRYRQLLVQTEINDKTFVSGSQLWWKIPFALMFSLPCLAGMIITALPFLLSALLGPKVVKNNIFYDSVVLGLAVVFDMVYTLLLALLIILIWGWLGLVWLALAKILFILSMFVWEAWNLIFQQIRKAILRIGNPGIYNEMQHLRQQLLKV